MLYLDTSFYSNFVKGDETARRALEGQHEIVMPLPVIAELRYGFINGSMPEKNEANLQRFLAQSNVSISIPTMRTTDLYAEIRFFCKKKAKALSHNDLWIAALANENGGDLVTYDKDFVVLGELMRVTVLT